MNAVAAALLADADAEKVEQMMAAAQGQATTSSASSGSKPTKQQVVITKLPSAPTPIEDAAGTPPQQCTAQATDACVSLISEEEDTLPSSATSNYDATRP